MGHTYGADIRISTAGGVELGGGGGSVRAAITGNLSAKCSPGLTGE